MNKITAEKTVYLFVFYIKYSRLLKIGVVYE